MASAPIDWSPAKAGGGGEASPWLSLPYALTSRGQEQTLGFVIGGAVSVLFRSDSVM